MRLIHDDITWKNHSTLETTLARLSGSNARQKKLLDKSGTHMFHQFCRTDFFIRFASVFFLFSQSLPGSQQFLGGGGGEKESRESCPGCQLRHFQMKFAFRQ